MANPSILAPQEEDVSAPPAAANHSVPVVGPSGQRKLVRPPMALAAAQRHTHSRSESPLLAHRALAEHAIAAAAHDSSHAEAFYFQKQVQTQTLMCFVLEDGEQIEGIIEWYDRNAIKIRHSSRTLIYKACIKYLYKVGENAR